MELINFEDGQLVTPAYIEIDGVTYEVVPAVYQGNTPLSAYILNKLQQNIKTAIDGVTLYENAEGNNAYEIQMNDSAENYQEIGVFGIGDNNINVYQKVGNPNGRTFEMSTSVLFESAEYINKALCAFAGNKFYKYQDREYKINIQPNGARNVAFASWLKIVKIVGYKNI